MILNGYKFPNFYTKKWQTLMKTLLYLELPNNVENITIIFQTLHLTSNNNNKLYNFIIF